MLIIDCVKSPPVPAMQAAGVEVVIRYLAFVQLNTTFKRLTTAELATLRAANLDVIPNWEQGSQDWLQGSGAGIDQGAEAARQLAAFGFPPGTPCPGSNDMDMTRDQWLSAGRHFAYAYNNALTAAGYRPGVYGSTDVLDWYRTEINPDAFLWQAMSVDWAGGRNAQTNPHAHLRQTYAGTVGGVQVDFNTMINDWRTDVAFLDDPNAAALAWRMDGLVKGLDKVSSGPTAGEPLTPFYNKVADAVIAKQQTTTTGTVHVTGDLTVS